MFWGAAYALAGAHKGSPLQRIRLAATGDHTGSPLLAYALAGAHTGSPLQRIRLAFWV